jgi:hypothetical protein
MGQEIKNQMIRQTAMSLASFYKVPVETAMSTLTRESGANRLHLNPNDYPVIAEHAITGLNQFARPQMLYQSDIIYLLNQAL